MYIEKRFVEERFLYWVERIWGSFVIQNAIFNFVLRDSGVLMSVGYSQNPSVIGQTLYRFPKQYHIYINKRLFGMPGDVVEKIIIHEAVHVGIPKHDSNFMQVVRKYGGALTESNASGERIKLQGIKGGRFETIKEFDSFDEARVVANSYFKDNPNSEYRRVRIQL